MRTTIEPVTCSVTVGREIADAWRIFTEEIGTWWPVGTHSIGQDKVRSVVFESGAGGRVLERWADGTEYEWARIIAWEPPRRLVLEWHPTPEPTVSTEVEVRFSPSDEGTRVDLEHRGWEALREDAHKTRDRYDTGWVGVLGDFADRTTAE